jgi:hypothetical protein
LGASGCGVRTGGLELGLQSLILDQLRCLLYLGEELLLFCLIYKTTFLSRNLANRALQPPQLSWLSRGVYCPVIGAQREKPSGPLQAKETWAREAKGVHKGAGSRGRRVGTAILLSPLTPRPLMLCQHATRAIQRMHACTSVCFMLLCAAMCCATHMPCHRALACNSRGTGTVNSTCTHVPETHIGVALLSPQPTAADEHWSLNSDGCYHLLAEFRIGLLQKNARMLPQPCRRSADPRDLNPASPCRRSL